MRGVLSLLAGLMGVACSCGQCFDGPSGGGGCDLRLDPYDGGGYGGYAWDGGGAYGGYGGSLTCATDAGVAYEPVDGSCVPVGCAIDRADCDGLPTNGCEVPIGWDASNCGACANVCAERPCSYGSCFGPEVAYATSDASPITALTTSNGTAYFATGGSVYSVDAGGALGSIAADPAPVTAIAVASGRMALIRDGLVELHALGPPATLQAILSPDGEPIALAVDVLHVYVLSNLGSAPDADASADVSTDSSGGGASGSAGAGGGGASGSAGASGGAGAGGSAGASGGAGAGGSAGASGGAGASGSAGAGGSAGADADGDASSAPDHALLARGDATSTTLEPLASFSGTPRALLLDNGVLYAALAEPASIVALPTDTTAVSTVVTGGFDPARIAVDNGYVYVADRAGARIARVPISGGALETVTALSAVPFDVHADAGDVFCSTFGPNQLWHVQLPENELVGALLEPNVPIGVDTKYLWWAVNGGRLLRIPR